jgi:integrase
MTEIDLPPGGHFIGGAWLFEGDEDASIDPATGEAMAIYRKGSEALADAAVDAALALHGPVKRLTVFYGRRNAGGPPGYATVLKQWRRAVVASGVVNANLHDLRAVAVTNAHRQGEDAQALAGHSSAGMTRRYIRDKLGVVVTPPALSKSVSKSA